MGRKQKNAVWSIIFTLKFKNFNQESPPKQMWEFFKLFAQKLVFLHDGSHALWLKMDDLSQFPVRRLQSANIA